VKFIPMHEKAFYWLRGGFEVKVLPWCAVCRETENMVQHVKDCKWGFEHEFKPVYDAEEVDVVIDELKRRLVNALEGKSEARLVRD